jgi:hypothetical protein
MLVFQWNALRVRDRVTVHDDHGPGFALHEGAVGLVQGRQQLSNDVGVRLDDQVAGMLRPRRHAVHLLPIDEQSPCWRCDAMTSQAAGDHPVTP